MVCSNHPGLAEIPATDGSQLEMMSKVWDSLGISRFDNSWVQDGSSSHSESTRVKRGPILHPDIVLSHSRDHYHDGCTLYILRRLLVLPAEIGNRGTEVLWVIPCQSCCLIQANPMVITKNVKKKCLKNHHHVLGGGTKLFRELLSKNKQSNYLSVFR